MTGNIGCLERKKGAPRWLRLCADGLAAVTLSEARSRLNRRRSLQVNSHFAAFFKICKIFILLHRSELNFLEKIVQNFQNFCKIFEIFDILQNFVIFFSKSRNFWRNFRKFCDSSGAKVCKSCRSWKMLKNDYLVVEIGIDTAKNEPCLTGASEQCRLRGQSCAAATSRRDTLRPGSQFSVLSTPILAMKSLF